MMHSVGWTMIVLAAAQGEGRDPVIDLLQIGASGEKVHAVLDASGVLERATFLRATPQALARGLVDTGLLETLNGLGLTPRSKDGALDPSPFFEVITARKEDRVYALALEKRGKSRVLRFALVRIAVPIDPSGDGPEGWTRDRLRRLNDEKRALARYGLSVGTRDAHGNAFSWMGTRKGGRLAAVYLPERDELRVVLY